VRRLPRQTSLPPGHGAAQAAVPLEAVFLHLSYFFGVRHKTIGDVEAHLHSIGSPVVSDKAVCDPHFMAPLVCPVLPR
jgi:hypothetical protein